jgi:tetratricopeptide (TPR) repeat protein
VAHYKVGNARRRQGNLNEALESFRTSLAIVERLAVADPSNATWQRDLAFSHSNIGLVHRIQSNSAEALTEFRKGRMVIAALAGRSSGLEQWKKDLAWFDQQIATLESQARPTLQGPGALWGLPSGMIWPTR